MSKTENKDFLLSDAGFVLSKAADAAQELLAENRKLKKALCELDTGGGDYFTSRRDIAGLSGLPVMGASWDEHIEEIRKKLKGG